MDATISLSGKDKTGTVHAQKMTAGGECLLMDISTDIHSMGDKIPYEKCRLYLHGSVDSIRGFAERIIAALPDEPSPQPDLIAGTDLAPTEALV